MVPRQLDGRVRLLLGGAMHATADGKTDRYAKSQMEGTRRPLCRWGSSALPALVGLLP